MVIIDRLLIGAFLVCCALATGFLVSLVPLFLRGAQVTFDFTGLIFKISAVFAVVLFILAMLGKEDFALKLISAPWRFLDQVFRY